MWTTKYALFTFISITIILFSCKKGPTGGVPAYLKIDDVSLSTKSGEGTDAEFISTLWLETEGEVLGVFELPCEAPALVSGLRQVIINPGIFVKGDYNNREIYPMYKPFKTDVNFVSGETVSLSPVFEYYDEVDFPLIEDFETGNVFGSISRTDITDTNNIEGKALHIHLDAATPSIKGVTSSSVSIPPGKRVYFEVQFKGDVDFAFGIESLSGGAVLQSGYINRFYAQDEWYKLYYDITFLISDLDASNFNFFVEAIKLSTVDSSDLYIDNFKIVVL